VIGFNPWGQFVDYIVERAAGRTARAESNATHAALP
jgi:hypothetical protein